jgi:hypothetical protein
MVNFFCLQAVGSILSSLFFPIIPFILQLAGTLNVHYTHNKPAKALTNFYSKSKQLVQKMPLYAHYMLILFKSKQLVQ